MQVLPQQQARHIRSRLRPLPEADVPRPIRPLLDDTHSKFGRNAYYERRRGDTALTPKEQRIVLDALKKVGVKEEVTFESYEENTNWYD
ncbi:MAG: DUF6078 family protein [Prevotella sp.]|nr:DUF6078 family protein [Prevotella sp.]